MYGKGEYTLASIPRYAVSPSHFRMTADIQPFSHNKCHTYIMGLTITGNLLGSAEKVEVRAATNATEFGVRVGADGAWQGVHELIANSRHAPVQAKEPVRVRRSRRGDQVWIHMHHVHVKIVKPLKARHHKWNWLNVFVSGMSKFKTPVGGLLGQ